MSIPLHGTSMRACAFGCNVTARNRSKSGRLLATADDFGCVKVCYHVHVRSYRRNITDLLQLFRFPAVASCQKFRGNIGHSAHVMCVCRLCCPRATTLLTLLIRGVRFTAADKCVQCCANTVCFCNNDRRFLVSVGGDDRSMFQWKVVKDFANSDAF
jgi:hypothetical protein